MVGLVIGCGPKEDASGGDEKAPTTTTTGGETADKTGGETGDSGGAVTNEQVVGEWTMSSQQPTSQVEAEIVMNADGAFVKTGTVTSEQDTEVASMRAVMTYTIEGKWKIEGDMLVSTPDNVDLKVDEMELTAKDPANQAGIDAQKEEQMKKMEEQGKAGLSTESKVKVEKAEADKLHLTSPDGQTKLEYVRKK